MSMCMHSDKNVHRHLRMVKTSGGLFCLPVIFREIWQVKHFPHAHSTEINLSKIFQLVCKMPLIFSFFYIKEEGGLPQKNQK